MKKLIPIMLAVLMLTGCGAQPTFETVDDLVVNEIPATAKELIISLPETATSPVMEEEGVCLYDCGDYLLTTQTLEGGDLDSTLQCLTGFTAADLYHMKTKQHGIDRYDCVWTAVGEAGEQVCRAVILDDGNYHYAVTVMADATESGALMERWHSVLGSVAIKTD